jgi:hypothetical protein
MNQDQCQYGRKLELTDNEFGKTQHKRNKQKMITVLRTLKEKNDNTVSC